jgi:hypothetical protein
VPPEDGRLTPETCRGLRHNSFSESESVLRWLCYRESFLYLCIPKFTATIKTVIHYVPPLFIQSVHLQII